MSDLKLIDELLCVIMQLRDIRPPELENHDSLMREAMQRLRRAYKSGEMPVITLSFANYFAKGKPNDKER